MKVSKFAGHWNLACGLILAGLILAGCKSGAPDQRFAEVPGIGAPPPSQPADPGKETTPVPPGGDEGRYDKINSGDSLLITITDIPQLVQPSIERVHEDGTITLLQNQTFTAKGKTRGELEKEVRSRYVPDYFKAMTITIVPARESQFYTVGGEVKIPGRQVYLSRIKCLAAIKSAGDFNDYAWKSHVEVTRSDGRRIQLNAVKAQKDPKLDIEIYPGDDIQVPRKPTPFSK